MDREPGKRTDLNLVVGDDEVKEKSEYRQALETNKINRDQASRYQQLAEVPEDEFEPLISDPSLHT
jgi:hypothetical protein